MNTPEAAVTEAAFSADDERFMRLALTLGRRGLGNTWPNPAVGAVIVKDGVVVGRGWTQPGGRPHAETEALRRARRAAHGATLYVTLEPCSHHGKTPPCADAVIKAGIARVVSALEDQNPEVGADFPVPAGRVGGGQDDLGEVSVKSIEGGSSEAPMPCTTRPSSRRKVVSSLGESVARPSMRRTCAGTGARARRRLPAPVRLSSRRRPSSRARRRVTRPCSTNRRTTTDTELWWV